MNTVMTLMVRPDRIVDAAISISSGRAIGLGICGGTLTLSLLVLAPLLGGSWVNDGFAEFLLVAVSLGVPTIGMLGLGYSAVVGGGSLLLLIKIRRRTRSRHRAETSLRAFSLTPFAMVIPAAFWFPFGLVWFARQDGGSMMLGMSRPDWVDSAVFSVLGSPMWIPLLLAAWAALAVATHGRVKKRVPIALRYCKRCGYSLDGISTPGCPECGDGRGESEMAGGA